MKAERVNRMEEIEVACRKAFWQSMVGSTQQVLPEEEKDGMLHGFTENYCPVRWKGAFRNEPVSLCIIDADDEGLLANEN